jgi:predicted DNA-binding transcriptional regulator AlpA
MRFIRSREVVTMIGVSRTTLWRMVRAGAFPAPIRITERSRGYLLDTVEDWMRERTESNSDCAAAGLKTRARQALQRKLTRVAQGH